MTRLTLLMTDKEKKLRQIIDDFENRKLKGQLAIEQLQDLTGELIDIGYLSEYWASEDLDMFVKKLLTEPINNWFEIDDKRAIELINEIKINITDDSIVQRNSTALEKRYGKPTGTVRTKIYHENINDTNKILDELKKETRIFL
jgi:hypothetical protein